MRVRYTLILLMLIPLASTAQQAQSGPSKVMGTVYDAYTGEPIPNASISLRRETGGTKTDANGKFVFQKNMPRNTKVMISAIGYETRTTIAGNFSKMRQVFFLEPRAHELAPVTVISSYSRGCRGPHSVFVTEAKQPEVPVQYLQGRIVCLVARPAEEKKIPLIKRTPQKDIVKVYPNPTIAGNSIQAAMQLEKADQYQLDLIDASGRVVWMQRLNIVTKNYNLTIPTLNTWSAGVYYLRVTSKESNKIYSGKIVIQ